MSDGTLQLVSFVCVAISSVANARVARKMVKRFDRELEWGMAETWRKLSWAWSATGLVAAAGVLAVIA